MSTLTRGPTAINVLCDNSSRTSEEDAPSMKTVKALIGSKSRIAPGMEPFALVPAGVDAGGRSTREYLAQLARYANDAATSLYCGSILAGHTSETDEYADVAILLANSDSTCEYGPGHELDVISALGLGELANDGRSPTRLELSPATRLPETITLPHDPPVEVVRFSEMLKELRDPYAFYFPGRRAVYFLLGHYKGVGLVGLMGIGVQT